MGQEGNQHNVWKIIVDKRLDQHDELIRKGREQQILDGHDIKNLKEGMEEIKDNTKWTRRAIANACIVAIISGVAGIVFFALQFTN